MELFRYSAMPKAAGQDRGSNRSNISASAVVTSDTIQTGELAGNTASEVRASLRRIGLQVVDIKPVYKRNKLFSRKTTHIFSLSSLGISNWLNNYLVNRRRAQRAELYDSMATMLESGLPLLEILDTLLTANTGNSKPNNINSKHHRISPRRRMLLEVREGIRSGMSLADALQQQPAWFTGVQVTMVEAGLRGGTLSTVLQSLSEREQYADELGNKLINALAYPALVLLAALGVVLFLSNKTLKDLAEMLTNAGLEVPALTRVIIAFGQFVFHWWWLMFILTASLALLTIYVYKQLLATQRVDYGYSNHNGKSSAITLLTRLTPVVLRRKAVGELAVTLAEMLQTGVPLVDALKTLIPTTPVLLRSILVRAAQRIEQGEELADTLSADIVNHHHNNQLWFTPEFIRLLSTGQASGDMDNILKKLGHRYQRQTQRLINQLATWLEPTAIIIVAFLVGLVVLSAVLPLIRLQEIIV